MELGIGKSSIVKALAETCGRSQKEIYRQFKDLGDLGLVAQASRLSQSMLLKPDALTVTKVFNTFLAKESGQNSREKKKNHIKSLLLAATDCEPLYLTRLLQKELRIGASEQTLLSALGQAAVYSEEHAEPPPEIQSPSEEAAKIVKQVYSVLPDYDKIVCALLSDGVWRLPTTCNFTPGVPVGPMLSNAITSVSKTLNKFQNVGFTCEYKYDGERAQIHYMENGSIEIYSKKAERNTKKFPDVAAAVARLKKIAVSSFVMDCEIVAYDRAKQKILPLQHLYASFEEESGFLQFATSITSNNAEEIKKFLDESVNASLGDTLDLVPIGAFHGCGQRAGVYGTFLLACYDNDNEEFQTICKTGIGFSEKELEKCSARLRSKMIPRPTTYYRHAEKIKPDVWFEATEAWEVKASDLTISNVYQAAVDKVDSDKGISLRCPRLVRVRPDKVPEDTTSSEQVAEMFKDQKQNHPNKSKTTNKNE
ncbi:unnamed protein product [Trifolium pratense]|uniref:Uncharacterized protein n=1 Tax=Trifolium pratense TaxID=57577 RepID=A0ACB0LEF2_TRIPR|nr:unnamed protein product [Trifolium pratense]